MKIKNIMTTPAVTINENENIFEAINIMNLKNIGFLVVLDDNNKLQGVFTDRDALLSIGRNISVYSKVKEIMHKNVITIDENMNVIEASELFGYFQVKRLVVLDSNQNVVGVISLRDLALENGFEEYALDALYEISIDDDLTEEYL